MRGPSDGVAVLLASMGFVFVAPLSSATLWDHVYRTEITPPLQLAQGALRGVFQTSAAGRRFMGFHGIPFGRPPVGALRFQAPQAAGPWDGVRDAQQGNICPQSAHGIGKAQPSAGNDSDAVDVVVPRPWAGAAFGRAPATERIFRMSEDCLYLNVFAPVAALPAEQLLPVLFYIHGGSYQAGAGDALLVGPDYIMDRGVVLVTINYRLGPLGFLATTSPDAPGNAGLKDQLLALQWVRDNVRHFGGDPGRVTLYGCSAGSVSAHLHVLAPSSRGLFRAAALSSGAATLFPLAHAEADMHSRRLAEALGANAKAAADAGQRVRHLRAVRWQDLMAGADRARAAEQAAHSLIKFFWWKPVVEAGGAGAFLDRHPDDVLRAGDFDTDVALMIGLNEREGTAFWPSRLHLARLLFRPALLLPDSLASRMAASAQARLVARVSALYLGGRPVGSAAADDIATVLGDEYLAHSVHVAARWHTKHAKAPVFLYYFVLDAFSGTRGPKGPAHAVDQRFVFKNRVTVSHAADEGRLQRGVARMTSLLANFASQRNPTPERTTLLQAEWAATAVGRPAFLEIGDGLALRQGHVLQGRMHFWDREARAATHDPIFDFP